MFFDKKIWFLSLFLLPLLKNLLVMSKKIVYVVGGLLYPNGMCMVLSQKINYLAEHTNHELHMILTEKAGVPWYYKINPRVKWVNFDINFDELDTMPLPKKIFKYLIKQRRYKKHFTSYLMKVRPDITVSTVRREINFLPDIKDGSKKVGEIHFSRYNYRQLSKPYLPTFVNKWISSQWMRSLIKQLNKLDQFVVLSEEDCTYWPEVKHKCVIHNSLSFFPTTTSSCRNKTVIAAGRYTAQKGFDMLIEAWALVHGKHPDWQLNIYGNGDFTLYQQQADSLGLNGSLVCHDAVKNIYDKYLESSIFVLSSRYEGFGMVLAEAMSAGLPAVSFSCPCGPRDIITNGEDGILVERNNIEQLANGICFLIEHEDVRCRFGTNARKNMHRFEQEKIMQKWICLFDSL